MSVKRLFKIQTITFILSFLALCNFATAQGTIKGYIFDKVTRAPLIGAIVIVPGTQIGATADTSGYFIFTPTGKADSLQISFIGYNTITVKARPSLTIFLEPSANSLQAVVITALGNKTTLLRAPEPVTIVTHDMLVQQASSNVIDAIALQPGINQITTGPGISKPEINGLGFNRVLTLFDGERQEDFQWGDEHGILIDPYAVYNAEIIRGPASLQYGANAVAGVLSFKSEPLPQSGTIQGSVLTEYQTNNGMIGTSFDVAGNNNGFVWGIRASNEEAHCYSDPKDGYVWGTAYNQDNIRAVVGFEKSWGYSHLSFSTLHRQAEIADGNRDSATGKFEFDNPQSNGYGSPQYYSNSNAPSPALVGTLIPGTGQVFPTRANFFSYNPDISVYQVLDHDMVWWQNSINLNKGTIGADIGYTQSHRQEIDSGSIAAENMTVHDIPYSFKYQISGDSSGLKFTGGVNGIYEFENNAAEPPAPYIGDFEIPNYTDFDIGGYGILEKDYKNLTLSGGLRYDYRGIAGQSMYLSNINTPGQAVVPERTPGATQQFPGFDRSYTGLSGSIGGTYLLPEYNYVKLNIAKSYRAPSISELTSNELDPANIYRQGNPNLKAESGYEADVAYGNNGRDINFEVDGFANYIANFIFDNRISNYNGTGDSVHDNAPVYKYQAFDAIIGGVTAYFNIHPAGSKWFELDNGFTYTYSYFLHQGSSDSTLHVPWTPAPRLTSQVKFKLNDRHKSILRKTYFAFGLAKYWAQNDIYSALYNELPSVPYTLYNAGIGANFINRKTGGTICSFYVNCTNLTNLAYIDHTSRMQYFWEYNGTSQYSALPPANYGKGSAVVTIPSEGIYNMGRNIGFKLLFPIGGHKTSDTEMKGIE